MENRIFVIYLIVHKESVKVYVGKTGLNPWKKRWGQHITSSKGKNKTYLYDAIRFYGIEAFDIVKIDETFSNEAANELEKYYIKTFESHDPEKGYKLTLGGDGGVPTEETKRKMSIAGKGKRKPQGFGSMISEANKRRVFSPETRAKMSANRKGKTMSLEARKKISESLKGRTYSSETIAKKSKSATGKSPSQETRDKISASLKKFNIQNKNTKEQNNEH
jgi:group I intron endonuclease